MRKEEQNIINHWLASAKRDRETAQILFDNKKYDQCLFYCHLFLEKTLKALYLKKKKKTPPYTHKLVRLALLSNIKLDQLKKDQFDEITTFNLEARYDDYKSQFFKKAVKNYAQKYLKISKKIYLWLSKKI